MKYVSFCCRTCFLYLLIGSRGSSPWSGKTLFRSGAPLGITLSINNSVSKSVIHSFLLLTASNNSSNQASFILPPFLLLSLCSRTSLPFLLLPSASFLSFLPYIWNTKVVMKRNSVSFLSIHYLHKYTAPMDDLSLLSLERDTWKSFTDNGPANGLNIWKYWSLPDLSFSLNY